MTVDKKRGTGQYLAFRLKDESFAVDVAEVREILDYEPPSLVPRMPDYMRGVINVRGGVVSVIDMGMKFGLSAIEPTLDTRIVVLEVEIEGEATVIGALVDAVDEVLQIDEEHMEAAPKMGTRLDTSFIVGMGRHEERLMIVLDATELFGAEDAALVRWAEEALAEVREAAAS